MWKMSVYNLLFPRKWNVLLWLAVMSPHWDVVKHLFHSPSHSQPEHRGDVCPSLQLSMLSSHRQVFISLSDTGDAESWKPVRWGRCYAGWARPAHRCPWAGAFNHQPHPTPLSPTHCVFLHIQNKDGSQEWHASLLNFYHLTILIKLY